MTTFADMLYQLGGMPVLAAWPIAPGGTWYWVDPVNGSASNDGLAPVADNSGHGPLSTVSAAYAKCTADKHDVVVLMEGDTASSETSAITWSKDYTHLIGLCSPTREGQRARITCGAEDLSPFFTLSANGCVFANIRLWQGQNDAHSLVLFSVTGQRNYFWNVNFAGGGHTAQAIDGGASLLLNGGDENTFERCTIGIDTVAAATGMANLLFDDLAARNRFTDCRFLLYAGHAGAKHVEVVDNAGIDRFNEFDRCLFLNTCRTYTLTEVFTIPASMTSVTNYLLLRDCFSLGATDWESNNRGVLYLTNGAITAGGNAGLFAVSNST